MDFFIDFETEEFTSITQVLQNINGQKLSSATADSLRGSNPASILINIASNDDG